MAALASTVPAGASLMPIRRTFGDLTVPITSEVRHEDGEISWTRHEHADGTVTHLPDHVAMAAKYDAIFGRL